MPLIMVNTGRFIRGNFLPLGGKGRAGSTPLTSPAISPWRPWPFHNTGMGAPDRGSLGRASRGRYRAPAIGWLASRGRAAGNSPLPDIA